MFIHSLIFRLLYAHRLIYVHMFCFRHMHGYGSHTFKMVNANDEPVYCKFHYKTDQVLSVFRKYCHKIWTSCSRCTVWKFHCKLARYIYCTESSPTKLTRYIQCTASSTTKLTGTYIGVKHIQLQNWPRGASVQQVFYKTDRYSLNIKVFFLKMIFLNSASSAAALVVYLSFSSPSMKSRLHTE